MSERQVAESFPPGDFIREEIDARGWTQNDLADITGKSVRLISEVVSGKRGITPDTARALAGAFGTSAQLWLNMDSAYQLSKLKSDPEPVMRRAKLYGMFPVKEMLKRGWVEDSESLDVLESRFAAFCCVDNLAETPRFHSYAARRTSYVNCDQSPALMAWLHRTRQLARGIKVEKHTVRSVDEATRKLKLLMADPEAVRQVPRVLADSGIRFVLVEPFPGMKVDGVCYWMDATSPVIAMTLRFDRIDNFWFVLMHELRHVANKDGQGGNAIVDENLGGEGGEAGKKPEMEVRADREATAALIPSAALRDFVTNAASNYSESRIEAFAAQIGVHPGIVIGQLHNRRQIPYSHFRKLLVKVREYVIGSTLTDGWGHHAPVQ